jgi:hypothetical protein
MESLDVQGADAYWVHEPAFDFLPMVVAADVRRRTVLRGSGFRLLTSEATVQGLDARI